MWLLLSLMMFCLSCDRSVPSPENKYLMIMDRAGNPTYRARMFADWEQLPRPEAASLDDTITPIAEFLIAKQIRLTIHSFPSETLSDRVPPQAQVSRWRNQLEGPEPQSFISPQAFSGYTGLMIEAEGTIKGKPSGMLAWSLQLADQHYRSIKHSASDKNALQRCADITIKAIGPPEAFLQFREDIIAFAQSFEQREEIPVYP